MRNSSQRGVALVVTLLMLSVITFLAVAFLALSGREKQSVNMAVSQSEARLMSEAGLARAQAELAALVKTRTNLLVPRMIVSRSYQNSNAISGGASYTNVNYATVSPDDYLILLTNLYFDPRLPVFVKTNDSGPLDFRFYLDFNRNGRFDTNGVQAEFDRDRNVVLSNSTPSTVDFPGDPEYIGLLERPQFGHSGTNRALGRFAYMILPVGQSLDLNTIHNFAKGVDGNNPSARLSFVSDPLNTVDGFNRNQGVGTFEINYAALLRDLSSNVYSAVDYVFEPNFASFNNTGTAFEDSRMLLNYRYRDETGGLGLNNLPSIGFGASVTVSNRMREEVETDGIDAYARNIVGPTGGDDFPADDRSDQPWPGNRNPTEINDVQELFDGAKFGGQFVPNLRRMGASDATKDRHGFYRLLSFATVSAPPVLEGKINLNYTNDPGLREFSSSYSDWDPVGFFTNVADRLIKMSLGTNANGDLVFEGRPVPANFGIHHIPVFPASSNRYSSGLHRLLQVAANLYDATTTNSMPTTFRPRYVVTNNTLVIAGYKQATNALVVRADVERSPEWALAQPALRNPESAMAHNMVVLGVPMVIGVKKGLPNFNELAFLSKFDLIRKLYLIKDSPNETRVAYTNQTLTASLNNQIVAELWNSYSRAYPNPLRISWTNVCVSTITTVTNTAVPLIQVFTNGSFGDQLVGANAWLGQQFILPVETNMLAFTNAFYNFSTGRFVDTNSISGRRPSLNAGVYTRDVGITPNLFLEVTNRLRIMIVDTVTTNILDYVSLETIYRTNVLQSLAPPNDTSTLFNGITGVQNQMRVSLGSLSPESFGGAWDSTADTQNERSRATAGLAAYLAGSGEQTTEKKAAFDAVGACNGLALWSANDPLVHYTLGDLADPIRGQMIDLPRSLDRLGNLKDLQIEGLSIGRINARYAPWPSPRVEARDGNRFDTNTFFKDAMVQSSDDWLFPSNKFASVGEIGRVHRGSPWQTIYLKSGVARTNEWHRWSGGLISHPTNDWKLVDLFTTAPSETAARGLLSINQQDQAAWAAVLGGVLVQTNTTANPTAGSIPSFDLIQIEPDSEGLRRIVGGIRRERVKQTNSFGMFTYLGQLLSVPELSDESPYLNIETARVRQYGLTDEMQERIPRRILSLVQLGTPKYMVYSYGQSLRPAEESVVNESGFLNLVTNYQVTGEVVTRTLLRVEGPPQSPRIVVERYDVLPSE